MRHFVVLFIHLIAILTQLLQPGGVTGVTAQLAPVRGLRFLRVIKLLGFRVPFRDGGQIVFFDLLLGDGDTSQLSGSPTIFSSTSRVCSSIILGSGAFCVPNYTEKPI